LLATLSTNKPFQETIVSNIIYQQALSRD